MPGLDSLPSRPLRQAELDPLRESDAVVEAAPLARAGEEIRHLAMQVGESLYGVGYREDEGWSVVTRREADHPDDLATVRDELRAWANEQGSERR